MKTIDRTEPSVTSLDLSRKITSLLEGIGVRVETYFEWVTIPIKETKKCSKVMKRHQSSLLAGRKEIDNAYTSDDLMVLLIGKGRRFNIQEKDVNPEALGKLLVHLIEEGVITKEDICT